MQPMPSLAAHWFISPSLELTEEYNSNVLFSDTDRLDDFITRVRPRLQGNRETEVSRMVFDTVINGEKYAINPDFDTIEGNASGSWTQLWSERFQTRLGGLFAHDETLETELERAGLIENRVTRIRAGANLGVSYALSERWSLGSSVGLQKNQYPDGGNPDLTQLYASLSPAWQWNERNTLGATLGYAYASYDAGIIDRTMSATLNWERRLAETRVFRLEGGYRYTALGREVFTFFPILKPDGTVRFRRVKDVEHITDSGFIFSVGVDQLWSERLKTTLAAGREHYNAADGSSADRNYMRTVTTFQLAEKTTLSGELGYDLSTFAGSGGKDEHLLRAAPVLAHRLTEHTSLRLGASYDYSVEDQQPDAINRNRVRVWAGITMDWPRLWSNH